MIKLLSLFSRNKKVKTPVKKGDIVYIGEQYPTLEVKEIYELNGKFYARCVGWLSQKYFADLRADKLIVIED